MSYATIITKLGKAAISKAIADREQISLTKMGVGQSKNVISDEWETLPEEAQKFSISDIRVKEDDANIVIVQGILEASVGGFVIRQVGIYGADDKLFAVANVPETIKPRLSEGAAKDLTINFYIALSDTGVINLTVEESSKFASCRYVDTKFEAALVETKANELYAPKTHNHDEVYLKIEDFEKYKNQKSAEEGEFLNKFIKDPTSDKISYKFFCLEDPYTYPITKGGLVSIKDKYLIVNEGGSSNKPVSPGVTAYTKPYKQISKLNENGTGGTFRMLFTIGDDVYFCQSANQKLWKYNIPKNEWTYISNYEIQVTSDIYISPKYPLIRADSSNNTIAVVGTSKTIKTQANFNDLLFIEDFIVVKNGASISKVYKVSDEFAITEASVNDLPLKEGDIKAIKINIANTVSMRGNYYKNGSDIYAFRYKDDGTSERNFGVLVKNKTQVDIPIQPVEAIQEDICLLRGTRYILRRHKPLTDFSKQRSGMYSLDDLIKNMSEDSIYTDLFDIVDGKKPIRLPVLILSGEETEKGLKIAFLAKPRDFIGNCFYETIIPYEDLKGLQ